MKSFLAFIILIISFSCSNLDNNIGEKMLGLADKDTLYICACKSKGCGGEWGCSLELNKIYKTLGDNYTVSYIKGIRVWNADSIADSSKVIITKELSESDQQAVEEYLNQIQIADTMLLTSNGPNRFSVKSKSYYKLIYRDDEQWYFYQQLTDIIYY